MKLLWLFLWRWSWLLTVPCCAFLLVWLLQFAQRYAAFQLRYDVSPYRFGWGLEGGKHASRLWRELQLSLQPHSIDRSLRTVQLFVGADALAQLDNDLPHSGFEPVPGRLLNDGKFLPVEVRYRGDFLVHWAYDKKSLRVKLGKNDSYLGLRTFNLIAPKFDGQVNDLLGYVLARHLGVLAPRAELVWLQLNGRFCGLYTLVEQLGEGTLRDNDRMPGDLFVGELVAKDSWQGVDSNLFEHPGLWTKAAVDARLPAVARRPLQLLCELVNSPASEQVHAQLAALLDLQALGRMAALEILIGFFHTGENHNWRLYWDPARSRFEPIVWDLCAFGAFGMYGVFDQLGPTPVSLDPNADRLHNLLLGNAWFLAARQAALRRFLEGDGRELFRGELTRAIAAAALAAQQDPLLWPPDPAVVRAVLARLPAHVERVFDTVAHAYLQTGTPVQWQRLPRGVRITVADRVPVTGLVLHFAAKPASVVAELQIARTGETLRRRLGATAAGDRSIRLATGLHAQLQPAPTVELGYFKVGSHRVLPSSYDIELNGLAADAGLLAVDAERASGSVEPAQLATDLPSPQLDLLYGVGADEPQATTSWAGIVRVTEAQELRGDLVLAPGTEVRMAAGASLLLHGRLLALGTAEQPIRFVPAAEGQPPWGTVALLGPGAAGSQLRHCQWSGGSERSSPEGLFA
ncbi:MAG TPA: CotH kinase family protein, partial [Planctomycetota bacterium]|nr:CotH kinase family protein [Planctomycetota bacterium]